MSSAPSPPTLKPGQAEAAVIPGQLSPTNAAAGPTRQQPPPTRQASYGPPDMAFAKQFDYASVSPPTSEMAPFYMAPMASALPHGGQPHPSQGGHRPYNYPTSPSVMHPIQQNHYIGLHPGHHGPPGSSMMVSVAGYFVQQPQMTAYFDPNSMPSNAGQQAMQSQGNVSYYPVQYIMEHPQRPGYFHQPPQPQYHDMNHQRPDHMMNPQNSYGHTQQQGRTQARRPSNKTNRPFRDQISPPVGAKQQPSTVRGPPRKPHLNGHAIWIGNLPPQTELMSLVSHVCKLAPGLQSVFLISKSNCAFANFKEEETSIEAQKAIHESRFESVRLVCRLRKNTAEAAPGSQIVIAAGTSSPSSHTSQEEIKSPQLELPNPIEASDRTAEKRGSNADVSRDRFFVLKSLTREDLEQSVRTGIWATQSHNEELLNGAFKAADNVYLIFSANKSGEYFGFARMTSAINQDPNAAIQFAPQAQAADKSELPQPVTIEAKDNIPRGRIIDDSARGTVFWEVEGNDNEANYDDENETMSTKTVDDADEDMQTQGKPFNLQWLSTTRLPFYRTKGLRNSWNSNREVKIARDGTELEPSAGRRLIQLFNHNAHAVPTARPMKDAAGNPTVFNAAGRYGN